SISLYVFFSDSLLSFLSLLLVFFCSLLFFFSLSESVSLLQADITKITASATAKNFHDFIIFSPYFYILILKKFLNIILFHASHFTDFYYFKQGIFLFSN